MRCARRGGVADVDGAGHVGAVAIEQDAEVEGDESAAGKFRKGCVAMGQGRALAAGNDGLEGHSLGAGEARRVLQFGGDCHLRHARLDEGEDAVEETAAEGGGGAQAGDLFGVLDLAQFGDQRVYSDEEGAAQFGGDRLAHGVQGGDGGLRLVEAAAPDAGGGDPLACLGERRPGGDHHLGAHRLGIGLGYVAAIGKENRANWRTRRPLPMTRCAEQHKRSTRPGKAAQPAHIREMRHQQRVYPRRPRRIRRSPLPRIQAHPINSTQPDAESNSRASNARKN